MKLRDSITTGPPRHAAPRERENADAEQNWKRPYHSKPQSVPSSQLNRVLQSQGTIPIAERL